MITYSIYSLLYKLCFSPYLRIFNSRALFTAGLEGHSIFLFSLLCDGSIL